MLKQFTKYGSSEGGRGGGERREKDENTACHLPWQEDMASTTTVSMSLLIIKNGKHYNHHCSLSNTENVGFFKR